VTKRDVVAALARRHAYPDLGRSDVREVIRMARDQPGINAGATYLRDRAALEAAGADGVFTGEGEVALALTEAILARLGASPDQIDRERDRARRDLFGAARPATAE
jgi:CPA2 family monovalent cation:H+ antiporter-2